MGYDEGVFSKQENKIIQNINLKKIKASEIMTPRVVIFWKLSLSNFKRKEDHLNFSRIPIQVKGKITGYIYLQDILENPLRKNRKY